LDRRGAEATARACSPGQVDPKRTMTTCASEPALCANLALARVAAAHQPVYRYVYSHVFHAGPLSRLRAGHGMELSFVFHNFAAGQGFPGPDSDELGLSDRIVRWWSQFARTGDPNAAGDPVVWPRCQPSARGGALAYMEIDSSPQVRYASPDACRLWEAAARSPAARAPARRR
jgi:carboxylesterase type B